MQYDVCLWGFDDTYTRDVIRRLENEGIINIKRWFISESMADNELFYGKEYVEPSWHFDLRKDYNNESAYPPESIDKQIFDNLMMILHNFTRVTDYFSIPMHEVINMIHCLKNHYYYLLKKDNPSMIIFYNLPHYQEGIVLYFLAKAMGIKTLLLTMTSFIGEVSYCYSLEDYGKFEKVPEYKPVYVERRLENIETSHRIVMPYTTPEVIKHDMGLDKPLERKIRGILHPLQYCKERYNIIVGNYHNKYDSITDLLEVRLHKSINGFFEKINYSKRFKSSSVSDCNLKENYVYFPLHLQPEMSTDTQGGMYTDQLLALEKISNVIPKNWKIYVKENPKQTAYKRGKYFFRRLKLIPNVQLLPRHMDTIALMENAKCVVTINGTAAWEAVRGGKPAIIFGKYWYEGLPGIFKFYDGIDIKQICQYKVDRDDLNKSVYKKKMKMLPVVLYDSDIQYVKDFDMEKNKEELFHFFQYILPLVE